MTPSIKKSLFSLVFLFLAFSLTAQAWDVKVLYLKSNKLYVEVTPDYEYNLYYTVFFPPSVLNQNLKDSIMMVDTRNNSADFVNSPFELGPTNPKFSYLIDLNNVVNVPTQAYLNFNSIQIVNWEEILFDCDKELSLDIQLIKDGKVYEFGTKDLSAWKAKPSNLVPTKTLMALNNIEVSASAVNSDLVDLLTETLQDFKYFVRPTELILLFGKDSLGSGGVFYEDMAIVYIDAQTSGENPELNIQNTILHELYHKVSPYEIHPEIEARKIDKNWLSEATPEYLSLKYLLQKGLIKDSEFLSIMEQKMRIAERYDGLSLDVMSQEVYRNSSYYQAFYSKGCVAFWLLDMKLFEISDGTINAIDLIKGEYSNLDDNTQSEVQNVMFNMEQELVFNAGSFPMNKYLNAFGLKYDKQIVLPFKKKSETAEVRRENITLNKLANGEQKSLWKRFISE